MRPLHLFFVLGLGLLVLATCQLPQWEGRAGTGSAGGSADAERAGTQRPQSNGPQANRPEAQPERGAPREDPGQPVEANGPTFDRAGPVVQLGHATPETYPGPVDKLVHRGNSGYWGIRLKAEDRRNEKGHIAGKNLAADEDLALVIAVHGSARIGLAHGPDVDIVLYDHHVPADGSKRGAAEQPIRVIDGRFRITIPKGETGWAVHADFPQAKGAKCDLHLELIEAIGKDSHATYPIGWNATGVFRIED
jgi:hypothetical protein